MHISKETVFFSCPVGGVGGSDLREAAKKIPPLMAGPLRGGGVGKGRAIKEKRTFFESFFLFCCHLKIKIILL